MVQVHFQRVSRDAHRWKLVAPTAVVPLIVGIGNVGFPASFNQSAFSALQMLARNEQIYVAGKPPSGDPQILRNVGSPLQQDDG